MKMPNTVVK